MQITEEMKASVEGAILKDKLEQEVQGKKEVKKKKVEENNIDIERAVLENMGNFKELTEGTLNLLNQKLKSLNDEYEKYNNEKYSDDYKKEKLILKKMSEDKVKQEAIETIDMLEQSYIKRIYNTNKAVVDSLEYQTRLNNFIKLMELSKGDINKEAYQFIIEAKDSMTLKVLAGAFKNNTMLNEFFKIDPVTHEKILKKKTNMIKAYIQNNNDVYSKVKADDILNLLQ